MILWLKYITNIIYIKNLVSYRFLQVNINNKYYWGVDYLWNLFRKYACIISLHNNLLQARNIYLIRYMAYKTVVKTPVFSISNTYVMYLIFVAILISETYIFNKIVIVQTFVHPFNWWYWFFWGNPLVFKRVRFITYRTFWKKCIIWYWNPFKIRFLTIWRCMKWWQVHGYQNKLQ